MGKSLKTALVMLVFCFIASGALAGETKPIKVRVAYHPGLGGSLAPGVDRIPGNGFFAKRGLDVEWIKFTAGPPEVAAMISGDIQFGYIGHGAHTLAAEGKIDLISLSHLGNAERIFTRKNSGISDLAGLKGKTIATQLGTSGETILKLALEKAGLTREDVKVINMDMGGAVAAFIANQVDAIACWDIHATNVQEKVGRDNLIELASTDQFQNITSFPGSWAVTPKYAAENRETIVRFLMALHDCYDFRQKDYDAAIKSAAELNGRTFEDFNKTRDTLIFFPPAEQKKMFEDGSLKAIYQKQLDYFIKDGKVKSGDVNKYVRIDLMSEALGKGGR